jgi:pilus assembly protein CpaB
MANRLKLAVVAAVIFGFIAAASSYSYLRRQNAAAEAMRNSLQNIVVAAKEIPPGTVLDAAALKEVAWPKDSVPAGSYTSADKLVGKAVRIKLVAGEPILEGRITGEAAGLPGRLTPGYRALAMKVDEIIGVSGFIAPDDRVDVIATVVSPGSNERVSKIVLQDKRVLSVASNAEQKATGQLARSITLEVTPEEAERLSIAQNEGSLSLALRSSGDEKKVDTVGSSTREIFGGAKKAAVVRAGGAAPAPRQQVEIYLGDKKSVAEF